MTKQCVVHLCADYPDHFRPKNTPVIQRLVSGLREGGRHVVLAISRVSQPDLEKVVIEGDDWSIRYFAPPLGIMHHYFLSRLAKQLQGLLVRNGIRVALFVGHKFTVESVVCRKLAQAFDVPYVAAFMGNTDRKIFNAKPLMRRVFVDTAEKAGALIFPTPWAQRYFEQELPVVRTGRAKRVHLIPYISGDRVEPVSSPVPNDVRFVSIFRLDAWRLKNVERVIAALSNIRAKGGLGALDIIGGGTPKAIQSVERVIHRYRADSFVRMLGEKSRSEIDCLLPQYCAMVLPSYPESFGLVYLEALSAGVPIMTASNAGFDGYFEQDFPGVIVAHDSVMSIEAGLRVLAEKAALMRETIQNIKADFEIFERNNIVARYQQLIADAIG